MTTRKLIKLSKSDIQKVKEVIKKELSFSVRLTINNAKYGEGTFNILPTKKDGRKFAKNQVLEIMDFMDRHNLYTQAFAVSDKSPQAFWQGISYILAQSN